MINLVAFKIVVCKRQSICGSIIELIKNVEKNYKKQVNLNVNFYTSLKGNEMT